MIGIIPSSLSLEIHSELMGYTSLLYLSGIWPCLFQFFASIYLEVAQRPSQNPQMAAVTQTFPKSDSCEINENTTVCNRTLENFRSCLKRNLCGVENSSAEGSGCKLCPRHWVPHRDKCYWLSEENQYWSRGQDDCSRRRSHLLVIQDREELEFTQNLTGNQIPAWIGLNITSPGRKWTWVDGSPLNQTL
nr:killer cell lectin-like receptor subfamily F member 1 [Chrysemys picta bellii]